MQGLSRSHRWEKGRAKVMELGGWTKRARSRLELVSMDGLGRQSADRGRVDGPVDCLPNRPRSYSSGTLFPECLRAANRASGPATPPQDPPPGLRPRGQGRLGREKEAGCTPASGSFLPSLPHPSLLPCPPPPPPPSGQLLHLQKDYFPRTIRRLTGGWCEIIHLKSLACRWHTVGTQEIKRRGSRHYHYPRLTEREAEA